MMEDRRIQIQTKSGGCAEALRLDHTLKCHYHRWVVFHPVAHCCKSCRRVQAFRGRTASQQSKFEVSRKNKRDILILSLERAKGGRERGERRGEGEKKRERRERLLSSLQVNISAFQPLFSWDHELIGRCRKLPSGISQR